MATASAVERELLRSDTEHNVSELPSQASSRHMLQDIESDELAENSEDEKKLRSAERRELLRMKFKSTQSKMSKATVTSTRSTPSSTHQTPMKRPSLPQQPFRRYPRSFQNYGRYSPTDKCFSCGAFGHWAGSPKVGVQSQEK